MERPLVVVMGVSGSGKSTVGALIAQRLGVPFIDADELHSARNIRKMAGGSPLTDGDRRQWLTAVGRRFAAARDAGLVIACSALKREYRRVISSAAPEAVYVHLSGAPEVLEGRLRGRSRHFMPPELLESQLLTLEELQDDERGVTINVERDVETVVADAVARIGTLR